MSRIRALMPRLEPLQTSSELSGPTSGSAHTTSPGLTVTPPRTTGTLTEPGLLFTVPWQETWRVQTGKPMSRRSAESRTPASITSPRTPRAISDEASRSPNIPWVDGAVLTTTKTSPSWHTSTAAWIMMLSPG